MPGERRLIDRSESLSPTTCGNRSILSTSNYLTQFALLFLLNLIQSTPHHLVVKLEREIDFFFEKNNFECHQLTFTLIQNTYYRLLHTIIHHVFISPSSSFYPLQGQYLGHGLHWAFQNI